MGCLNYCNELLRIIKQEKNFTSLNNHYQHRKDSFLWNSLRFSVQLKALRWNDTP